MSDMYIDIPDDLFEQLTRLSQERQRTINELLQDAIRRYIVADELAAIRAKSRPYAEAQGYFTDDDVFGAVS